MKGCLCNFITDYLRHLAGGLEVRLTSLGLTAVVTITRETICVEGFGQRHRESILQALCRMGSLQGFGKSELVGVGCILPIVSPRIEPNSRALYRVPLRPQLHAGTKGLGRNRYLLQAGIVVQRATAHEQYG